jgi:nicotinamidase-related amidase
MKHVGDRSYYDTWEEMSQPGRVALLIIDQQNDFVHADGYYARQGWDVSMLQEITPNLNRLANAARGAGVPVYWSQNHIKSGFVSDAPVWLATHARVGLASLDQTDFYTLEGTWGAEIYEECDVDTRDVVIPKLRSTVFHNTPLEALLRAVGTETLVIAGQVTEGCVDNTIRGARDRDFYTVLLPDAVGSTSRERHERALLTWVGRIPTPTTSEVVSFWEASTG